MTNRELMLDYLNCTEEERDEKRSQLCSAVKNENERVELLIQLKQEGEIKPEQGNRIVSLLYLSPSSDEDMDVFGKELKIMTWLADSGCAWAQCRIAELYELGLGGFAKGGLAKDERKALAYYEKAAKGNEDFRQWVRLGRLYKKLGMPQKALNALLKPIIWENGEIARIKDFNSYDLGTELFDILTEEGSIEVKKEHIRTLRKLVTYYCEKGEGEERDAGEALRKLIQIYEMNCGKFSAENISQEREPARRSDQNTGRNANNRNEQRNNQYVKTSSGCLGAFIFLTLVPCGVVGTAIWLLLNVF